MNYWSKFMLYLISLYYKKSIVTGANKRFDEIGLRLARQLGSKNVRVIVMNGECPKWCDESNVYFIKGFKNGLQRIISNIYLSNLLNKLPNGTVISDFMPLPFWGLKKHKHFQLIHDLRSFSLFSRMNLGRFTSNLQAKALNKSQKIIAVSEFTKNEVISLCNVEPDRVIVSYNGVNVDNYKDNNKDRDIDFLYVATFEPRKNHINLLLALKQQTRKLNVVLVGRDLGELESLEPLISEIIMAGNISISIIESTTDLKLIKLYNNSKTFISPALLEGFGMPLIEAAICGCRVICSDIPVFHEILDDHAVFFNPNNVDEIAKTINLLSSSIYKYDPKIVEYAFKHYSWDNIASKLIQHLEL